MRQPQHAADDTTQQEGQQQRDAAREWLERGRKERDRLKVLDQIGKKQITQVQAAVWLGLSTRQVRRLERRYQSQGDHGLIHRLRGRQALHIEGLL